MGDVLKVEFRRHVGGPAEKGTIKIFHDPYGTGHDLYRLQTEDGQTIDLSELGLKLYRVTVLPWDYFQ